MYENYYPVAFIMKTKDGKEISEMNSNELYWVSRELESLEERTKQKIKERREELHDKYMTDTAHAFIDKFADRISSGKVTREEAAHIIVDIFFRQIES